MLLGLALGSADRDMTLARLAVMALEQGHLIRLVLGEALLDDPRLRRIRSRLRAGGEPSPVRSLLAGGPSREHRSGAGRRVAVVTGGARAIGGSIAAALAATGHQVVIVGRTGEVPVDLASEQQVRAAAQG